MIDIPYGDPGGMRGHALNLERRAQTLEDLSSKTLNRSFMLYWDGPAGSRFRESAEKNAADMRSVAREIRHLASYLRGTAQQLEFDQGNARRLNDLERQREYRR